jgi:uncharacterized protein YpbB
MPSSTHRPNWLKSEEKKTYKNNNENEKKKSFSQEIFLKAIFNAILEVKKKIIFPAARGYDVIECTQKYFSLVRSVCAWLFYSFFSSSLHTLLFRAERRKQ